MAIEHTLYMRALAQTKHRAKLCLSACACTAQLGICIMPSRYVMYVDCHTCVTVVRYQVGCYQFSSLRFTAYRLFVRRMWRRLGCGNRRVLPACVVRIIPKEFPSGICTGFLDAEQKCEHHMALMEVFSLENLCKHTSASSIHTTKRFGTLKQPN